MKPNFQVESGVPYIDNSVTTSISPTVLDAMLPFLQENFGDPEEPYSLGVGAAEALASFRESIAEMVGADPAFLWFTSGGTEANNWVMTKTDRVDKPMVACSSVEHLSVLRAVPDVRIMPVDSEGRLSLDELRLTLDNLPVGLVSVQHANQETGVVQDVEKVADICREHNVPLHVDAAMSFGVIPVNIEDMGADFLTLSSHKAWGPVGSGALVSSGKCPIAPLLLGGPQEGGMRAGPVNMAAIAGFAKAAQMMYGSRKTWELVGKMRDTMESQLEMMTAVKIVGKGAKRLPNVSCFVVPGSDSAFLAAEMERLYGMCVGIGGAAEPGTSSRVLAAMGILRQEREATIRMRFGPWVQRKEMDMVMTGVSCAVRAERTKSIV